MDLAKLMEDYTLSVVISSQETLVSAMDARTKHLVLLITFSYNTRNGDLSHLTAQVRKHNRFGNAYYHCNSACVMTIWPTFIPTSVVVPVEVQSKLLPQHKFLLILALLFNSP